MVDLQSLMNFRKYPEIPSRVLINTETENPRKKNPNPSLEVKRKHAPLISEKNWLGKNGPPSSSFLSLREEVIVS